LVKFDYLVVNFFFQNARGRGASGSGRDAKEGGVKGETGERKRKKIVKKKENQFVKKKN